MTIKTEFHVQVDKTRDEKVAYEILINGNFKLEFLLESENTCEKEIAGVIMKNFSKIMQEFRNKTGSVNLFREWKE